MAQTAVGAITTGCEMLREGKQLIDDFKDEAEGVVGQINEAKEAALSLWETISGLVEWVQGLVASVTGKPQVKFTKPEVKFTKQVSDTNVVDTTKSTQPTESPKPVAKKTNRKPAKELTYEEYQARAVHDICENLKVYFEAIRQLKVHCRELEEESLTTEKVADSAIDRIEIQWQMQQLGAQLKQAMIYGTPRELGLGAMYEDFLIKYDEIVEAQEVARELKVKQERDKAWQQDLLRNHRIDRSVTAVLVMVAILWMWGLFLSIRHLGKIPAGSLLGSLF